VYIRIIVIYTAADSNYLLQAAVLIRSISLTQKSDVEFFVIGNGWSKSEISKIENLSTKTMSVKVLQTDNLQLSDIRLGRGFPHATLYNILAPSVFLEDFSRALYLDADMVVTQDLTELWNTNLRTPVGAVLDAHIVWVASPSMWRPWREECLSPLTPYLNTGMMLIDLEAWRNEELTNRCMNLMEKYSLPCVDQDALNLTLKGNFDQLHPRFNSMPYHHLKMFRYLDTVETNERIGEAILYPSIIHYHRSFLGKPWTYFCTHPGVEIWRHLATEFDPSWSRVMDFVGFARSTAARMAKMTILDERTHKYGMDLIRLVNQDLLG
jgi:lipopolysaccharide biosynthesis glycosyltransferase